MKQCSDYLEQISAYADGELSSVSEARDVELHLAVCKSCSAFYAFSREISKATTEALVEPPSELASRVMNQVMIEPAPGRQAPTEDVADYGQGASAKYTGSREGRAAPSRQNKAKSRNLRLVMSRIVPIAACLVLIMLVWQFGGGFGLIAQDDNMAAPEPAAAPADEALANMSTYIWADEPEEESEADIAGGVIEHPVDDTDDVMLAHRDGEAEQQMAEAADAPDTDYSYDIDIYPHSRGEHPYPVFGYGGDEAHILFGYSEDLTEEELEYIYSHVAYASFVIAITGELPYFLTRFEPEPNVQLADWEMVFDITTDQARLLLSDLAYDGATEFEIIEQNTSNHYAIVLFSRV